VAVAGAGAAAGACAAWAKEAAVSNPTNAIATTSFLVFMIFSFSETCLSFQLKVAAEDITSANLTRKSDTRIAGG
jgi:hypothetical protein